MPGYNAFSCDLLVLSRRRVAQLYTGISAGGGGGYAQILLLWNCGHPRFNGCPF